MLPDPKHPRPKRITDSSEKIENMIEDQVGGIYFQFTPAFLKQREKLSSNHPGTEARDQPQQSANAAQTPSITPGQLSPPKGVVTLINGFSRTRQDFKIWTRILSAQGYATLTLDNRASGQSTCDHLFEFSQFATDIRNLWDYLAISQSHVLGISMGGVIAQILASDPNHHVSSLIVVSSLADSRHFTPLTPDDPHSPHDPPPLWHPAERYFATAFVSRNPIYISFLAKEIRRHDQDPSRRGQLRLQRKAFADFNVSSIHHHAITAPTLVIHGGDDRVVKTAAANDLVQKIPHAQLKIHPDRGHLLLAENSAELFRDTLEFIKTHSPTTAPRKNS